MSFHSSSSRFAPRARRWVGWLTAALVAAGAVVPAAASADGAETAQRATLLVSFQPGLSHPVRQAAVAAHGAVLGEAIDHTGFFVVSEAAGSAQHPGGLRAALAGDPRVAVVEADQERSAAAVPNDPRYGPGQAGYLAPLHLPEAWDLTTGSDDQVLAVVDSGVAAVPELAGRLLPGRDLVNGDNDATDDYGHGTEVATVAAVSTDNKAGMAGVAWQGKILPVKVLDKTGKGTDATIAAGITWAADHGAHVINLSLGAPAFSATLKAAVGYARSRDVVVVAAAGNEQSSGLNYPAGIDGVAAVTAIDADGVFAPYSNWGQWIDLAAPGDVLAGGKDGGYKLVQGTSYAAPIVAAVALLTRARYPAEAADQIIGRLRGGARDAGPIGVDERYGFGIVDALGALGDAKPARGDDPARLVGEPDNSPARAAMVPAGAPVEGTLAPEGDTDWFAVDLPSAQWIRVTATARNAPGDSAGWAETPKNPEAVLFGADLSVVNENRAPLEKAYGGYAYAPPGRMYVRVRYPDQKVVGTVRYTVRVDTVPAPPRMYQDVVGGRNANDRPKSVTSGDVNGDGHPDLVVSFGRRFNPGWGADIGSVGIYDGDNEHADDPEVLAAPAGTGGSTGVAVGDLDGDGDGDGDVAAGTDLGVVIYEQTGGGPGPGRLIPLSAVDDVEIGDIDGDSRLDLVVTTSTGLIWLRNAGGGTFDARTVRNVRVGDATVVDIDGDGRDDIVTVDCDGVCSDVSVATSGAGGFAVTTYGTTLSSTETEGGTDADGEDIYPRRCVVGAGDITRDDVVDVFAACSDHNRVDVLRGRPAGGFFPALTSEPEIDWPTGLAAVDLDGDGADELAVLNSESISVTRAGPDGALADDAFIDLAGNIDAARAFTFADFDGDATVDVGVLGGEAGLPVVNRRLINSEFHGPRLWVADTDPADGSATVPANVTPTIHFVRPLDPAQAEGIVTMTDDSTGEPVEVTSTYDPATSSVVVHPFRRLVGGHTYRLDYQGVHDTDGNRATFLEPDIYFAAAATASSAADPPDDGPAPPVVARPARSGYWMVGADGSVYGFGDAAHHGRTDPARGAQMVDLEPTRSGDGYWLVDSTGLVTARGDALWYGNADTTGLAPAERITSLSATPTGRGYWLFTTLGRVITRGDAAWLGDMSAVRLNGPVLDSTPTPSGKGYYMVASDGGIFAFGDATFAGSMGGRPLNKPVQSLVPDPDGSGYWLVASDGGVFAFAASYRGSMGDRQLNRPVTGMVPSGDGYLMVGEDGGLFNFSNRPFAGSLGSNPPPSPIVSVAALT